MNNSYFNCEFLVSSEVCYEDLSISYVNESLEYTNEQRQFIEKTWSDALENTSANSTMFDGALFCLTDWNKKGDVLTLELKNTSYSEYYASRKPDFAQIFPNAKLANPLAVCSVIVTKDNFILYEQRTGVDVYNGKHHVIGGFMDRNLDIDIKRNINPFFSICREIEEELTIELALRDGILLGLVYDHMTPHPELCFTYSTDATLSDIQQLINNRQNGEVVKLMGIKDTDSSLHKFVAENARQFSVTGLGCLALHGKHSFGDDWFRSVIELNGLTKPSSGRPKGARR